MADLSDSKILGRIGAAGAVFALQACAVNPLVSVPVAPPAHNVEAGTLDRGREFSDGVRQAYSNELYKQVGTQANLSSGLIGLGAVVTALAVGKAHRDAILGTTLLGATAFSLGNWNLDKRRFLIYHGAISGFNCADRAVSALDMSVADLARLDQELRSLGDAAAKVQASTGRLESEVAIWVTQRPAAAPYAAPYNKAIAAARQAGAAADTTLQSGEQLRYETKRANTRLIDAVRKIDQEASAALLETTGDLNKVPTVIAGLAGIAGSIAPGSGVEALFSEALKNSVAGPAPPAAGQQKTLKVGETPDHQPPASLLRASADMSADVRALYVAAQVVLGRVRPLGEVANVNALADCGIGPLNFAMSLDQAKVSAPVGTASSYTVNVKGGKPPFAVRPNGPVATGVTLQGPDRFNRSFKVEVSKDVAKPQSSSFTIIDSSDPERSLPFSIEVVGAAPTAPPSAEEQAPQVKKQIPPVSATLAALKAVTSIDAPGFKISTLVTESPKGTFTVRLACTPAPKPPACAIKEADARKAYFDKVGTAGTALGDNLKFGNFPPGECLCK